MIALPSKSLSDNLKPVLSHAEGSAIQNRKWLRLSVIALGIVICGAVAEAQQTKARPRIAVLSSRLGPLATREGAFQEGLRKLGYVEGQSITIEYRYAGEKLERLPDMANELVRSKVDVIVAVSTPAIKAAQKATKTIPIIMAGVSDPIGTGFVESLARPGGNITGFSLQSPELSGKRLELLKQVIPKLSRVALLIHGKDPGRQLFVKEAQEAGNTLGLYIDPLTAAGTEEIEGAFPKMVRETNQRFGNSADLSRNSRDPHRGTRGKKPLADDVRPHGICGRGRTDVLRAESFDPMAARRHLRRQDTQRRQAGGSSGRAANQVRAGDQSQNCQADRRDHSSQCLGKSGSSN